MKLSNYLNKKTLKETYLRFSLINNSLLKKNKTHTIFILWTYKSCISYRPGQFNIIHDINLNLNVTALYGL